MKKKILFLLISLLAFPSVTFGIESWLIIDNVDYYGEETDAFTCDETYTICESKDKTVKVDYSDEDLTVITLNNYNGGYISNGLVTDLKVILKGDNVIDSKGVITEAGFSTETSTEFTGDGKLTIKGCAAGIDVYNEVDLVLDSNIDFVDTGYSIYADDGNIIFKGGKYNIPSKYNAITGYTITFLGGLIKASTEEFSGEGFSVVSAYKSIKISGGEIDATSLDDFILPFGIMDPEEGETGFDIAPYMVITPNNVKDLLVTYVWKPSNPDDTDIMSALGYENLTPVIGESYSYKNAAMHINIKDGRVEENPNTFDNGVITFISLGLISASLLVYYKKRLNKEI